MKQKKKPGNFQTLLFFVGFIILFFLVFALGVIVGKGLTDFETLLSKKENGKFLIGKVNSLFQNEKSDNSNDKDSDSSMIEVTELDVKKINGTGGDIKQLKEEAVTIIEENSENKEDQAKKTEDKKEVVDNTKKEEKNNIVAKLDYSIPEFPKTDPGGKYTVQLGSFQNIDTAYKLEKSLTDKGYPSFVIKAVIPKKGTWYRVRVGTFDNIEKAHDYAEKIKNKEKLEFTQITLNN